MSKPARSGPGERGSAAHDRSRRRAARAAHRDPKAATQRPSGRPARHRHERSFLDMLLISALIVIAAFIAVALWIVLRGLF